MRIPLDLQAIAAATAGATALLLSACGGGNDATPATSAMLAAPMTSTAGNGTDVASPMVPMAAATVSGPEAACLRMRDDPVISAISAQEIDVKESGTTLPVTDQTNGARITDANYIAASNPNNPYGFGYCEIRGRIFPAAAIDMDGGAASSIEFAVGLPNPTTWTAAGQIAVHLGGSGFDGAPFNIKQKEALTGSSQPGPLQSGYVVYGDDSGHQSDQVDDGDKKTDGKFALHDEEAVRNFGRMSLKKTQQVAQVIMVRRYKSGPARSYFLGTSTGGRDALAYLQRWPDDYQGAFVNQPALNYTATRLGNLSIGRQLYGTDRSSLSPAWISPEQTRAFQRLVLAECDGLDNAPDGVISNVTACAQQQSTIVSKIRRDAGPVPQGSNWPVDVAGLTADQLATLSFIQTDRTLPYLLANNQQTLYGYNFFQGSMFYSVQDGNLRDRSFGIQAKPSTTTSYGLDKDSDATLVYPGDQWVRYFVWRAAGRDWMTTAAKDELFNLTSTNSSTINRIKALSEMTDASNANLNRFFERGGRLIMMHGMADEVISTRSTINYYERVKTAFSPSGFCSVIRNCLRFYTVPGMGHGKGRYKPSWNALAVLHKWSSMNQAPDGSDLVIADKGGADEFNAKLPAKGTRPLCEYPKYPRFNDGVAATAGSMALAESYMCVE